MSLKRASIPPLFALETPPSFHDPLVRQGAAFVISKQLGRGQAGSSRPGGEDFFFSGLALPALLAIRPNRSNG
jgi:hypothetical protein